jgi:peptidyl-prolyl cis-trans isomerase D
VARAFDMKTGEVAGPLRSAKGFVFETVTGRQDSYVPKLDEVKDRVRDEVVKQKARDLARQKAAELAAKLTGTADFEKAAKAASYEAKSTDLITRDSPLPDVGVSPDVMTAAFALPQGAVSGAIPTDTGAAVVKVVEKKEVTANDWALAKDKFREDLLNDRRNRFFSAYMVKAKQKMKIEVNRDALQKAIASS